MNGKHENISYSGKKLSIIIPCYNAFDDLRLFLAKTHFPSWTEVIVVDDCSTDETYARLKTAFGDSETIRVEKTEKNTGPGGARNKGISLASGAYLTFLDSDDSISDEFFDEIESFLDSQLDCIVFDYYLVDKNKKTSQQSFYFDFGPGFVNRDDAVVGARGMPWGKIYKKSVIIEHGCLFLDLKVNEDTPFTKVAISFCEQIYYLNKCLYNYVQRPGSLMHTLNNFDYNNEINAFNFIEKAINGDATIIEGIFIVECLYATSLLAAVQLNRKKWSALIRKLMHNHQNYRFNRYYKRMPFHVKLVLSLTNMRMFFAVRLLSRIKNRLKG